MRMSDWSSDVCSSDLPYSKGQDDKVIHKAQHRHEIGDKINRREGIGGDERAEQAQRQRRAPITRGYPDGVSVYPQFMNKTSDCAAFGFPLHGFSFKADAS